jgi:hypothetical protein
MTDIEKVKFLWKYTRDRDKIISVLESDDICYEFIVTAIEEIERGEI